MSVFWLNCYGPINNARVVTLQKKRGLKVKSSNRMLFGGHRKGREEEEEEKKCWPTEIRNHRLQNIPFLSGGSSG